MILRSLILLIMGLQILTAFSCTDDNTDEQNLSVIKRVAIIPEPTSLTHGTYNVTIPKSVSVSSDIKGINAELLNETLKEILGTSSNDSNEKAFIRIHTDNSLKDEGYRISIDNKGCDIFYKTSTGLLWGVQTLRQVLLQSKELPDGSRSIPTLSISDSPKKAWRGFHVDVARHMFSLDYLKKIVDYLSFYKINKLQIHLTDDQGWRIEIKKYPELTKVGAWREFDEYDKKCIELAQTDKLYAIDSRFIRNGNEYGGYYTQDELKDFIEYATARGLEVIPEIDMPGHFSAAIRAFPKLSCKGSAGWGEEFSYPVCAGKTENYSFFKNIIDEVAELFPSKHFHIGGDEVEKDNWKECPYCQALIHDKGLMDEDGLQNYFIKEMTNYTKNIIGKQVMAWDDAFLQRQPQDLLYTYWRDWMPEQAANITQQGYPLIFMEWGRFYLSAKPSDEALQSLYEFEFDSQFPGIVKQNVVGFQSCLWTEMIPNEQKFGEHVFPSLQAFSELAWGSPRSWDSFTSRVGWHLNWLNKNGMYTRTPQFM